MIAKIKYGKIALVIFLTVLIWVWADLALDEELADKAAVVFVDESANPKFWVSFNELPSTEIKITLSGPHAAINAERRRLRDGGQLRFDFDIAQEKMDKAGTHPLNLLVFLQKDKEVKQRSLKVKSCQPETLTVNVIGLVKRTLAVEAIDAEQVPIKSAIINPSQVEMLVPEDWVGNAKVQLIPTEIKQTRASAIKKVPFIKLTSGQKKEASQEVDITTPPEGDLLREDTIKNPTLGFNLSANTQGKYKVEVVNITEVMSPIAVRATPVAKRAYEILSYQVILEIEDKDAESKEVLRRKLTYNFPDDFVRTDEIGLNQQPVIAQFKLTPLDLQPNPADKK
jgi:hypothetical protein